MLRQGHSTNPTDSTDSIDSTLRTLLTLPTLFTLLTLTQRLSPTHAVVMLLPCSRATIAVEPESREGTLRFFRINSSHLTMLRSMQPSVSVCSADASASSSSTYVNEANSETSSPCRP